MLRFPIAIAISALLIQAGSAQQRGLTLDDIYGSGGGRRFSGNPAASLNWLDNPWVDDAHYLWPPDDPQNPAWLKVDAASGKSEPLFSRTAYTAALAQSSGLDAETVRIAAERRPTIFNTRHDGFIATVGNDLFFYNVANARAIRLTNSPEPKEEATFSPDGSSVAFVAGNNLFVTSIASPQVKPLTTDGGPDLLNGKLDWVYSEELYGRGHHRVYWWSPDSTSLAFIQLNETAVNSYMLTDDLPYHPEQQSLRYPKAGDPNPTAKLGVVAAAGGPVRWIDNARYSDFLIVNVDWAPNSRDVVYQIQDRKQTWLDLNFADKATGIARTALKESSKTWVERWSDDSAQPVWLNDGSFLWLSERSGWRHLYHYAADGTLLLQVTKGEWEVRTIEGLDQTNNWVYFGGTERSVTSFDVYRVKLDGTGLQRLSANAGLHSAAFNPSKSLYLDSWSTVSTPPQVRLHRASGDEQRVVDANVVPALATFTLATPTFVQVKARDGFVMEAMMIKPPDFDPSKRYPVYQFLYGGPHAQTVVNGWRRSEDVYEQLLAQKGIIVWLCDNRTASGKGAVSAWPLYRNFGERELQDVEDCAAWLKQQPYVDASRIGVAGYSFGGYMTTYAMTHPSSFSMGIAGGSVTDWRDYDTIYTERYMGIPSENAAGYRASSPRFNAADLHGALLLTHNTGDDNVHLQNTMQFAYELQKAGKLFQLMIYPTAGHGVADPLLSRHERATMLDFTIRALRPSSSF